MVEEDVRGMILEVLRSGCVGGLVTGVFVGAFGVVLAHYLRERSQARREQVDREQELRGVAETPLQDGMAEERRRREEAERERDELRRELLGLRGRTEAHEEGEEQQGRGGNPNPLRAEHRGAHGGPGGVGCSAASKRTLLGLFI